MVILPPELLATFPPAKTALLDRVRRDVDDDMLRVISRADYGNQADELFPQLVQFRDTGQLPEPMEFWLHEVLALTRWSDPERPGLSGFGYGPSGISGHWTRLFVCAALLRADVEPAVDVEDGATSTLAQLLVSASVMESSVNEAIGQFLTWRLMEVDRPWEEPVFALALLVVAVRLRVGRLSEQAVGIFAERVLVSDAIHQVQYGPLRLWQEHWKPLSAELRREAAAIADVVVREDVFLCAGLIEVG
ncbi:hypothetical protein [Planctellipticum variicoloris]|uniref:hypothetical protein n=1 Tax=Planctellipticum variicoloris TaxID=3064265 RepID=UPI00301335F2|nr:hypothetical protein SH412_004135 [Planctomycetaceae bacterium SH412]